MNCTSAVCLANWAQLSSKCPSLYSLLGSTKRYMHGLSSIDAMHVHVGISTSEWMLGIGNARCNQRDDVRVHGHFRVSPVAAGFEVGYWPYTRTCKERRFKSATAPASIPHGSREARQAGPRSLGAQSCPTKGALALNTQPKLAK